MKGYILTGLLTILFACSKDDNSCWECTVREENYKNGVKTSDNTQTGSKCDKTESEIRTYEAQQSGDTTYNDSNGNRIRRAYSTTCNKK